jgi:hypothetical protein
MDKKTTTTCVRAVVMVAASLAAGNASGGQSPASYMPESLDGVAVRTCVVDVKGKSTCGPDTMGDAAIDTARLGLTMMGVAGLTGSDDKRWDHVVYGVTDKSCTSGGASMAAMRIQPGIFKDARSELEGLIASKTMPMEKARVEGVDVYVGYSYGKDCIMAFGYPSDSIVLVASAGPEERDRVTMVIQSMLAAATRPGRRP